MTRINTNVGSLIAQKTLSRTSDELQQALTRLSTGLRINSGKDDPAGLIASENLRRDITSANAAIGNSQQANNLIGTADSALGQISNLLNDIRGLAVQAANTGVLSDEQIAADQLQVDASLEAIDRIAKVTTFQGRKLLDGSLDFTKNYTAGGTTVADLSINSANLGTAGSLAVTVNISAAATQALLTDDAFGVATPVQATGDLTLTGGNTLTLTAAAGGAADGYVGNTTDVTFQAAAGIAQSAGVLTLATTADTINIAAVAGGAADGTAGDVDVVIAEGAGPTAATYSAGTITINVDNSIVGGDTTANIAAAIAAIGGGGVFTATATSGAANYANADDNTYNGVTSGGSDGTTAAVYNATTNVLTVSVALDGTGLNDSVANVAAAIDAEGTFVTSNAVGANFDTADFVTNPDPLSGGVGTGLQADLVVRVGGDKGSEVFNFRQGATIAQVVSAINLVSDGTGVQATNNAGVLNLQSTSYGSNGFVDVEVLNEGTGGTFGSSLSATHAAGTDIAATVNGATASGAGNTLSVHTSTLDLSLTVNPGSTTTVSFDITGGGAVFQLGPNVVTNQQARIGIGSVNTGTLGGTDGRLYELRSGYGKDLATNPNGATLIVDEAINKVTGFRGRLGAFQRTTIETNIASLKDTITNLTQAQSQVRDADFASETAALTRAQVLTQSGTQVLAIANQQPQNVLALLRNL